MSGIAASNTDAYVLIVERVQTGIANAVQYAPVFLVLQGIPKGTPADITQIQARLVVSMTGVVKRTLNLPSRITKAGLVDIQLLIPKTLSQANLIARQIADCLEQVLQGRQGAVLFIGAFNKPMPEDPRYLIWRIQAKIQYDIIEVTT